jgi:hypothetical protein
MSPTTRNPALALLLLSAAALLLLPPHWVHHGGSGSGLLLALALGFPLLGGICHGSAAVLAGGLLLLGALPPAGALGSEVTDTDGKYAMKLNHPGSKFYEHLGHFCVAMTVGPLRTTLGGTFAQYFYQVPAPCCYTLTEWGKKKYFLDFLVMVVLASGATLAVVVEVDEGGHSFWKDIFRCLYVLACTYFTKYLVRLKGAMSDRTQVRPRVGATGILRIKSTTFDPVLELFMADARAGQTLLHGKGYELDDQTYPFNLNTMESRVVTIVLALLGRGQVAWNCPAVMAYFIPTASRGTVRPLDSYSPVDSTQGFALLVRWFRSIVGRDEMKEAMRKVYLGLWAVCAPDKFAGQRVQRGGDHGSIFVSVTARSDEAEALEGFSTAGVRETLRGHLPHLFHLHHMEGGFPAALEGANYTPPFPLPPPSWTRLVLWMFPNALPESVIRFFHRFSHKDPSRKGEGREMKRMPPWLNPLEDDKPKGGAGGQGAAVTPPLSGVSPNGRGSAAGASSKSKSKVEEEEGGGEEGGEESEDEVEDISEDTTTTLDLQSQEDLLASLTRDPVLGGGGVGRGSPHLALLLDVYPLVQDPKLYQCPPPYGLSARELGEKRAWCEKVNSAFARRRDVLIKALDQLEGRF